MSTMNISLPDALNALVDEQVSQRGYGSSSEYVRELIARIRIDCNRVPSFSLVRRLRRQHLPMPPAIA